MALILTDVRNTTHRKLTQTLIVVRHFGMIINCMNILESNEIGKNDRSIPGRAKIFCIHVQKLSTKKSPFYNACLLRQFSIRMSSKSE